MRGKKARAPVSPSVVKNLRKRGENEFMAHPFVSLYFERIWELTKLTGY
jgi:hypothetical protein